MQVQKQLESEYEKDIVELLTRMYKRAHSEAIKRGIQAKKLQKSL